MMLENQHWINIIQAAFDIFPATYIYVPDKFNFYKIYSFYQNHTGESTETR